MTDCIKELLNADFLEIISNHLVEKFNNSKSIPKEFKESLQNILNLIQNVEDDQGQGLNRNKIIIENSIKELCNKFKIILEDDQPRKKNVDFIKSRNIFDENWLLEENPNLKPNVVKGAFESLEEYLSIQQSLITEDFSRPLREGLEDLKSNQTKSPRGLHSYGSSRIDNVTWLKNEISLKVCKEIDWISSSRLIYGSLVILREGSSVLMTFWTVKDRSVNAGDDLELCLVSLAHEEFDFSNIEVGKSVQVYESQVYFEAYLPVIQTLSKLRSIPFKVNHNL
jgi:hypothetical protein